MSSICSWLDPEGTGFLQNVTQSPWDSNCGGLNTPGKSTEVEETGNTA